MDKVLEQLEFSFWDRLAMGRVEPFGMHLFELIHVVLFAVIVLWMLKVILNTLVLLKRPSKSDLLKLPSSLRVERVQCSSCQWIGHLPLRGRKCPSCGGDSFIAP